MNRAVAPHRFSLVKDTSELIGGPRTTISSIAIPLTAVFACIVARYSGEPSVDVEAEYSARDHLGDLTSRQAAFTVEARDEESAEDLLGRVRTLFLEHLPDFERLDLASVFQEVRFAIPPSIRQLLAKSLCDPLGSKDDPMTLCVTMAESGLEGVILGSTASFDMPPILRMAKHFEAALRTIALAPKSRIGNMSLLEASERQKILFTWNATEQRIPDGCVQDLFEQQAQKTPEAIALIQGQRRITYGELSHKANRLARRLQTLGVGPEVLVGICMQQTPEAVVGVLAILKAGGAYVPLDPGYPQDRISEIVNDSGLKHVVTTSETRRYFGESVTPVWLDHDCSALAVEDSTAPLSGTAPDSPAYVLYTSGSTGKPKGVVGIHRSIVNGLLSITFEADEVCCLNAYLSFGMSIGNLFHPLMRGIPLVLLSDEELKDVGLMVDVIERDGVTRIVLVPPVLKQLLDFGPRITSKLARIRVMGLAGTAVTPDLVRRLSRTLPNVRLHNGYSSSEIGTLATLWDAGEEFISDGEILVGRPVANTRLYILDDQMNPVSIGMEGEIYIGARHLARGYLHRPELTAQTFVPDPFSTGAGDRLYKTGDRGRFRADGNIEFLGRVDDLVKVRGFRVELAEVEHHLLQHRNVREVAVSAHGHAEGVRLVAYVTCNELDVPSVNQLRDHLRARLPEYMVPSSFAYLERLPVSAGGKVDRSALPPPDVFRPRLDSPYKEPQTATEIALAEIWREVFGLQRIGTEDHFLNLGGDSLLAVQIAVRVEEQRGREMSLDTLFAHPTIAELASYLDWKDECLAAGVSHNLCADENI